MVTRWTPPLRSTFRRPARPRPREGHHSLCSAGQENIGGHATQLSSRASLPAASGKDLAETTPARVAPQAAAPVTCRGRHPTLARTCPDPAAVAMPSPRTNGRSWQHASDGASMPPLGLSRGAAGHTSRIAPRPSLRVLWRRWTHAKPLDLPSNPTVIPHESACPMATVVPGTPSARVTGRRDSALLAGPQLQPLPPRFGDRETPGPCYITSPAVFLSCRLPATAAARAPIAVARQGEHGESDRCYGRSHCRGDRRTVAGSASSRDAEAPRAPALRGRRRRRAGRVLCSAHWGDAGGRPPSRLTRSPRDQPNRRAHGPRSRRAVCRRTRD